VCWKYSKMHGFIFSMNPSESIHYAGLLWQPPSCGNHTQVPGTDSTAHSLPSAVIDKEHHTLRLARSLTH
jgi:hypothetical protein